MAAHHQNRQVSEADERRGLSLACWSCLTDCATLPRSRECARKRLALALAIRIGLAVPAWADFEDGIDAFLRGDYATALQELKPRADQGHAKAQYNLGVMYGKGRGILKDYVQAPTWYNLAASRFAAGSSRDKAVKNRAALAERMTPAQSAEAQRLAREWKPKPE